MDRKEKPNILFILTDQHRLSAVGAYGETPCRTPRIDALAEEAVLFENAYTTCPVCSPARASIMTGLYPHSNGILTNIHDNGCSVHELEDRPELLSRRLEAAGYAVGYIGKWHLGTDRQTVYGGKNRPSLPRDVGFQGQNFPGHGNGGHGFEQYKGYLAEHGYRHTVKPWAEKTEKIWMMGETQGPVESSVPYFLAEKSIDLMGELRAQGKPFFLWHNFWGPHQPFYVPAEFLDPYRHVEIPPWANYDWPSRSTPGPHHVLIHPQHERLGWDLWAMAIRYYYAFTTLIDRQIGRMLDYLRDSGQGENTVVVFSADHGQTLGSHGGLTDKGWIHFEEVHRIPMIIRIPGMTPKRIDELVSLIDLYPTFLDLAGGFCDDSAVHGKSLLPLLSGEEVGWRDMVVSEFNGLNNMVTTLRTVRCGDIKYGFSCTNQDELYDLRRDPHETLNLIDHPDYRRTAAEMRSRVLDWTQEMKDPMSWWFRRMYSFYPE